MPSRIFKSIGLTLLFVGAIAGANAADVPSWKAAATATKITPEKGMFMMGFASPDASTGALKDIFVKALAIEDGDGARLVVLTYDLIGIPRTLRQALVKRCGEAYGLSPHALLLNASHSHSGPELRLNGKNADDIDVVDTPAAEAYGRAVEEKSFQAIGEVLRQLAPARVEYVHARAGFAMNRRRPTEKGYGNAPYADGPVDHTVPVLRVASPDGKKLRAVLFGYACHNTTLKMSQISGDYAGYAQEYIEAAHPGAVALFMQGCGGDQNPYPRRTVDYAAQHGRALANAVEAALENVPKPLHGPLRVVFGEVLIDYAPLPPRAEIEKITESKDSYAKRHAKWVLEKMDQGCLPVNYPCPIQVVRFGQDLVLAALGGEAVVDYSLRLKRELAGPIVWVAAYSNEVFAYVPSRRVLAEGGYEAGGAMNFSPTHPGPWAPSIEDRIIAKVHELDGSLKK